MKWLFCIILSFPFVASAKIQCVQNAAIKAHYQGKAFVRNENFCFAKSDGVIESESCFKGKCQAKKFKKISQDAFHSEIGSPGFKLCQQVYHSTPQVIRFKANGKWYDSSICLFPDDSFIDLGRLMKNSFK
jgi:hypothetical protein